MPDGATYRDHLVAAERAGIDTGDLEPKPIPSDCDQLLEPFWALRRSAGSNGMTANAISYGDMVHWQTLYGVRLEPMEIDLILAMDGAAVAAFSEKSK